MSQRPRLILVHTIEALMSAASNLLTIGVFFFMQHEFGWNLTQNFLLSAGLGVVYVVGALAAHPLSVKAGRRTILSIIYFLIAVITAVVASLHSAVASTVGVLFFAFLSSMTWPIIENLVSAGDQNPHALSKRLAMYNIVWATTGAMIIAVNGIIIEKFPLGVFLIPAFVGLIASGISFFGPIEPKFESAPSAHAKPEPQLARQRVVALWLSRISVPAMYLMIYSLAAMLPSLPVLQPYRPAIQTLLCSIWLVVRGLAFVILGAAPFWHTRPRLLLGAAAALLISLLLMTIPNNLSLMILGQIIFGASTGLIYTASLYFGMVLSEGSTEHGGYHEALIGLGMALGPAVGAGTQWLKPGEPRAAVAGIAGLIALSILFASAASLHFRRRSG